MSLALKVIVVDDEELARKRLENLIKEVPQFELVAQCQNGEDAIEKIESLLPDLIYLDIKLKDMSGFDVLKNLTITPIIIFVTAYDKFAIKAFDNFAFDYLLKPFKDSRFLESADKAIEHFKLKKSISGENLSQLLNFFEKNRNKINESNKLQSIPIRLGNKISFLDFNDIKYITASGYYAEIFSESKKHLIRQSLSNLIVELDSDYFIRIHRSTIINLKFMLEIINSNFGDMDVKMKDGKLFRISKSYKKDFLNKLNI
ncbi:LytTR family DNA-binding domain-containing protein [Yeosuana marina]|uniref:LytR/AlgR family response regulator transcription factor n=1 Tax=Yeosuana marina TaxID=1565536 RepID=UPI0030EEEBC0|tara:strand:+ start:346 stop:1122 length:777 start_codon:yes stop_codon:yes gene_type:complete